MRKFQLKSGKKIEFNYASIEKAWALFQIIAIECKKAGLNLKISEGMNIVDLLQNNTGALLNILSSQTVLEAVHDCCDKLIYDGQKFSMDLFNETDKGNIENRGDFLGIMMIVAIENLTPFFPEAHTILNPIQSLFLQ